MSLTPDTPRFDETFARPEALFRVPVGFASPLWGLFAGAAVGGSALWWMSRWARAENLEAMFGAVAAGAPEAPAREAVAELVIAAEAVVDESEAAAEAIVEPPMLDAPVGGEAAPIAPALALAADEAPASEPSPEPEAAPKARARRAEAKPD